ncbi:MAG: ATP-binding protein [Janthinobacterium lividum]
MTLQVALDDLPDGVVLVAPDGLIRAANSAAEALLGRARAELVGLHVRRALPLQDTSGRRWWDVAGPEWHQVPGGDTGPARREQLVTPEQMFLLPGGTELLVTTRYVRSSERTLQHVVIALRGTEQRRRAESDAGSLIATVAHELRSPLTSVRQFTATLLRKWDRFTDDQKRYMLTTVQSDAERVSRLVGDLLDVSRVDAGRLTVHRRPMDLAVLVREHVERLCVAGYDDDRFDLQVGPDLPELWADPDRMAQVVTNLIDNAVRHGAGTIRISLVADADELVLTVDDAGEGIAAENRPYVFSKFWRGGRRSGTGLGLYVTRGLVEAHGGDIEVDAAPAGGARFRVRLPGGAPPDVGL